MKDKILPWANALLIVMVLIQAAQIYFLKGKVDSILEEQIFELEILKEENSKKIDSIEFLKKKKLSVTMQKEQALYYDIAKANENNNHYEEIKKSIITIDNADSLARQLTKRYTK